MADYAQLSSEFSHCKGEGTTKKRIPQSLVKQIFSEVLACDTVLSVASVRFFAKNTLLKVGNSQS